MDFKFNTNYKVRIKYDKFESEDIFIFNGEIFVNIDNHRDWLEIADMYDPSVSWEEVV